MTITKEKNVVQKRPPVVVVLGHVDHGKTTLLDYIRKANIAQKEAGGITQSIGAYQIEHCSSSKEILRSAQDDHAALCRKVTFIDTPGHEAFIKMRVRGAKVADIAILVVAADDGVQPQTKESIKIIQEAKIPFVVAINKIDREGVDINKVKNELTAENVLLEGYGGNVSHQAVSAKTGQGVNELLDLILLVAELEELPYKTDGAARGVILESKRDGRRGIVATGIMKDGTLKIGDSVWAGSASGKVRGLENFLGKRVKEASPSDPVRISGFDDLPEVGAEFFSDSRIGTNIPQIPPIKTPAIPPIREISVRISDHSRVLNLILKADVSGSLEALSEIMKNLPKPEEITLQIIDQSVGEITDGDVQSAISTKAMIIGFRTGPTKAAENMTRIYNVRIVTSEIVYELVQTLEEEFKRLTKGIVRGALEVLAVFGKKGSQQIIGGRVTSGAVDNNAAFDIERRESLIGTGKILNLQAGKKDVSRLEAGAEGGLLADSAIVIKEGDRIIIR